jgi:hypothetical protein
LKLIPGICEETETIKALKRAVDHQPSVLASGTVKFSVLRFAQI